MDAIKSKIIEEFKEYLNNIENGYSQDYLDILTKIMFLEVQDLLDNPNSVKQHLLA